MLLLLFCSGCEKKNKEIIKVNSVTNLQKNITIVDTALLEISNDIPRGLDSDIKLYKEGLVYEQQKEYIKAIDKYFKIGSTITIEGPWEISIVAKLRSALCYIRLNENKKAIEILKNIIATPNLAVQSKEDFKCIKKQIDNNTSSCSFITNFYYVDRIGEINFKYRNLAEQILNHLGITLSKIYINLLQNKEPQVRNVAAERLTVLKDTAAIEPMKKLLKDYDGIALCYAKDKSFDTIYYLIDTAKKYFKTISDTNSK